MIQRIQSLFLLIAILSLAALFLSPFSLASIEGEASVQASTLSDGVFNVQDHIVLVIFVIAGLLMYLIGLFMFKNRPLQMRLTRFGIVASILVFLLAAILFMQDYQKIAEGTVVDIGYGIILPILAIVFGVVAMRNIRKDEKLVRSADRLR